MDEVSGTNPDLEGLHPSTDYCGTCRSESHVWAL
jgi:hypothetical protein